MSFSLAALMAFYTGSEIRDGVLIGHRGQQEYNIMDDADVFGIFRGRIRKAERRVCSEIFKQHEIFSAKI